MCLYDHFLKKVPKDSFVLESQEGRNPHLKFMSFEKLAKMHKKSRVLSEIFAAF